MKILTALYAMLLACGCVSNDLSDLTKDDIPALQKQESKLIEEIHLTQNNLKAIDSTVPSSGRVERQLNRKIQELTAELKLIGTLIEKLKK